MNVTGNTDSQDESQEIDSQQNNDIDSCYTQGDKEDEEEEEDDDDDDDDRKSTSESEDDNSLIIYEDNFQIGINTDSNEDEGLSAGKPDHRIQLVIEKSRHLINMIQDCSILSSFLNKIKEQHNQNNINKQTRRSLVIDVRTRWNSTYKILETLNMHRSLINELFQNKTNLNITKQQLHRLSSYEFSSDCWHTVEMLIKVLKPFYRGAKVLSEFLSVCGPTDDPLLVNMKRCLLKKMAYYDLQDSLQSKVIQCLNTNSNSFTKEKKSKKSLIDYFVDSLDGEDVNDHPHSSTTITKVLNEEFKTYKKLAAQFVSTPVDQYDPLLFWKQHCFALPNLATLAQKYLASPSTSIKSESAFSISAYYGRKQRARLSSDNLSYSVFLKDKLSSEGK
ncbi:unnamed protein product [Adineta ricciae]|uniref:HAT C-terminal dimerisation domain-containing protein n=1 Tax=Adineta ricciae TaxID=249248 RepID=A0A814UR18_ADIRI|nr:unnamed protein product [Adineta ricciae]